VIEHCPTATIAKVETGGAGGECSCETGENMNEDLNASYENCLVSNIGGISFEV
jgi:hypothetical protein